MTSTGSLNATVSAQFHDLAQHDRIIAEYVWIGGSGIDVRSKA